jgi:hypothetical protein
MMSARAERAQRWFLIELNTVRRRISRFGSIARYRNAAAPANVCAIWGVHWRGDDARQPYRVADILSGLSGKFSLDRTMSVEGGPDF